MARKTRRRRARPSTTTPAPGIAVPAPPEPDQASLDPGWKWRTFPVFVAFVCGMLLAFVVNEGSVNPVAFVLQLLALLGVGYAIAHLFVMNVVIGGRRRRRIAAAKRGERPADDYEDVVVYDDAPD